MYLEKKNSVSFYYFYGFIFLLSLNFGKIMNEQMKINKVLVNNRLNK